ncbi:MAG: tetratricopeptide repeat protein [Cyanobacteria bacterium SBLK]|nr:tetratricopeptide repeat protein [Cyanobacteria bacterium SBLK]
MTRDFYREGLNKAKQKDYRGAIAAFNEALKLNPYFADIYYHRGMAYFDLGELQQASFDYTQAIDRDREHFSAYYSRALARVALKNLPGALEDIECALRLDNRSAPAHQLHGTIRRKMGDVSGAIPSFKRAGELYLTRGDKEGARGCLAQIDKLKPKNPPPAPTPPPASEFKSEAYWLQLLERAEKGDDRQAIEDLDWLLQLDSLDHQGYCCRGLLKGNKGDLKGAIADFNQALRLDPRDAIAYRNRGKIRARLGDKGGAIADFNRAIEIEPNNARLFAARGNIAYENKNYRDAITDYSRSLELDPANGKAYLARGKVYRDLEEKERAIADYQQAADLFCEGEDWENYQKALNGLNAFQWFPPRSAASERPDIPYIPTPYIQSNPSHRRLLTLVGGHWPLAERLLGQAKHKHPGKSEVWYVEKVIYEIERDRGNW